MSQKITGLTDLEVQEKIEAGLQNKVTNSISKTKKQIIFEHTFTYFNALNIFLAIIILTTGRIRNLAFLGVIFSNTFLGIFQEFKVKKIIDQLSIVTAKTAQIVRNSNIQTIPVEDVVLNDIIIYKSGDQICADSKVIASDYLEVNESMLTGESLPVIKHVDDELLSGSFVVSGEAYCEVIRIANDNYASQLVNKARHKNRASSQMRDTIRRIIKVLSFIIVPVGLLLFYSQLGVYHDTNNAIVSTVGGIIGMIPEGLVLLTSVSFVLGVGRLAKKRALIQEMEAIEALARVNAICMDKTGTITSGKLKVENVDILCEDIDIQEILIHYVSAFDSLNETMQSIKDYAKGELHYSIEQSIPFSSSRKYSVVRFNNQDHIIGAPEFLLDKDCDVLKKVEHYSHMGYRVLLLATCLYNYQLNEANAIKPLSLVVISDVIREEAKDTIAYFNEQNVQVRILSGDNPVTVSKICEQVGIKNFDAYIDASLLPENQEELYKIVDKYYVYGRVKPEQKQAIVKALQAHDHIVSMVGDGVNDVLAIKDADCGIAMASGSEAAKQAAHIVLLDSNFASMKDIVHEGKVIISNIEKVSSLYLCKTIYSTLLSLIFCLMHLGYPFIPLHLSLIGGLFIGAPSFILTLETEPSLSNDGFVSHIVRTALPYGLTVAFYICTIAFLSTTYHISSIVTSSYYLYGSGFISLLLLMRVCTPFNLKRLLLTVLCGLCFYTLVIIMPSFFLIDSLRLSHILYYVVGALVIMIFNVFVRKIIVYIYEKIRRKA